jgi:iron complex outermembrane recepter protein
VFLDATNLTDREARPHTSFLRDVAPLPGRGLAFGVRAFF